MKSNIKKFTECNEYYCSICQDHVFETEKAAVNCFNSHKFNLKPGTIITKKCEHSDCNGYKTFVIPNEKFVIDTAYVCDYCNGKYESIEKAIDCFDSHFIEGKCLICEKN